MSFIKLLQESQNTNTTIEINESVEIAEKTMESPEDLLRNAGMKIKLVTPTAFGTQIDLYKRPDKKEIETILADYNVKFKNRSVFIVK